MLARAPRDYYAVLGVPRDADAAAIKKAYRALAALHHPDVSSEEDAGERFREIAEAYEVLSRPESRARYDRRLARAAADARPRAAGHRESGRAADLHDLVRAPRPAERGADVRVEIEVEPRTLRRGGLHGLRYTAMSRCEDCAGSGAANGSPARVCGACAGSGRVREVASEAEGRRVRLRACPRCRGVGTVVEAPCPACAGRGRAEEERAVLVRIPPRSRPGLRIALEGFGHAGGRGGKPGDLVVSVRARSPAGGASRRPGFARRVGRRR